jgi:hypothetical protein
MSQTPNVHVPAERRPLSFADSARSTTSRLRDPLPGSVLDALDAKARQRHAKLAKAATDLGAERQRLAEAVAKAPHADAEATSAAMLAGKPAPEPTEGRLRDELEQATKLEAAAGDALRKSATALLNAAAPLLADVDAKLATRAVEDADAIRAGIEDLRRQVLALGALHNEQGWIAGVLFAGGRGVPAYIERPSGLDRTSRALSVLAETFAEEVRQREERLVSASRQRERDEASAGREARDRAQRAEADARERERREQEAAPTAEQAQGRVWQGREPV